MIQPQKQQIKITTYNLTFYNTHTQKGTKKLGWLRLQAIYQTLPFFTNTALYIFDSTYKQPHENIKATPPNTPQITVNFHPQIGSEESAM